MNDRTSHRARRVAPGGSERLLLVRTGALGDIVHGIPVAAALKRAYPHRRMDWVAESHYEPLLRCVPCVDRVIPVRLKSVGGGARAALEGVASWVQLVARLRREGYAASVDLQGLIRSGVISHLSGAPLRIGFPRGEVREGPSALFTNVHPRRLPSRCHVIDRNLALLHPLGIRSDVRSFEYRIPAQLEDRVHRYLRSAAPDPSTLCVAIHPVAGWPTKEWAPERFAEIARRLLLRREVRLFLLWGPGERDRVNAIRSRLDPSPEIVPEMGLPELVCFLRRCDLFIGGDSGPMHLACSLERPVVALFGPTDPVRNGPFLGRYRVVRGAASCGPCYRRRCSRSLCMDAVSLERVWDAVNAGLSEAVSAREGRGGPERSA